MASERRTESFDPFREERDAHPVARLNAAPRGPERLTLADDARAFQPVLCGEVAKGRGAPANPEGRFEIWTREKSDDDWFQDPGEEPSKPKTVISIERAKGVISRTSFF